MRNGKIARLPETVRRELGRRLEDGASGEQVLDWLNGLPEVRATLKEWFGSRPVSKQNLSAWRQGGHQDWRRREDSRELALKLAEQARAIENEGGSAGLGNGVTAIFGMELARATQAMLRRTEDPQEEWKELREGIRGVVALRRVEHGVQRLRLAEERRELEREKQMLRQERQLKTKNAKLEIGRDETSETDGSAAAGAATLGVSPGPDLASRAEFHREGTEAPREGSSDLESGFPTSAEPGNPGESGLIKASQGQSR